MSDDSKVISMQQHRDRLKSNESRVDDDKSADSNTEPLPGKLIWMHCPTCDTYEFTELIIEGGRTHRRCGTIVKEVAVDIDVRAEYTIADLNQQRLRELQDLIGDQMERVEEYKRRLAIMAGKQPTPYDMSGDLPSKLPIAEMDHLGLFVSQASHNPQTRFGKEPPAQTPSIPPPNPSPGDEPEPA